MKRFVPAAPAAVLLAALCTALAHPGGVPTTVADPHYCVVIRDANGNPVNTTCIPWPFGG
jgi:hypothetical protein